MPYIVHKLIPDIYGMYVLAISLIGLMSFLDLGFEFTKWGQSR